MKQKKAVKPLLFLGVILLLPCLALPRFNPGANPSAASVKTVAEAIPTITSSTPREEIVFQLLHHDTGQVEEISDIDYIKGVVAAEMPISFEPEALKAQAVAAHTYALRRYYQQLQNPSADLKGAQFSTDPSVFQAYKSVDQLRAQYADQFEQNYQKLSDAVEAVIDYVITYDDQPIVAAFHSTSGGETEAAATVWGQEVPYLQPVQSEGDLQAPNYQSEQIYSAEEIRAKLVQKYPTISLEEQPQEWLKVLSRTESGTVGQLAIGDQTDTGVNLRSLLGLRSANFDVAFADGQFIFTTKGYGHGVGMSQYGANYLAQQGCSFEEILKHYYSGVEICRMSGGKDK